MRIYRDALKKIKYNKREVAFMKTIIERIAHDYKLNDNDLYLIQYIIDHSDEVIHLSTHQLAKKTFTSATAVIRCIKKLGFDNYNDFKIHLESFLSQYYLPVLFKRDGNSFPRKFSIH